MGHALQCAVFCAQLLLRWKQTGRRISRDDTPSRTAALAGEQRSANAASGQKLHLLSDKGPVLICWRCNLLQPGLAAARRWPQQLAAKLEYPCCRVHRTGHHVQLSCHCTPILHRMKGGTARTQVQKLWRGALTANHAVQLFLHFRRRSTGRGRTLA